jgi:hypothetical protein
MEIQTESNPLSSFRLVGNPSLIGCGRVARDTPKITLPVPVVGQIACQRQLKRFIMFHCISAERP